MIPLKEIRLIGSAPNVGVPIYANRRTTSSFLVGAEGVVGISLDNGFITVVTEPGDENKYVAGMIGMPASACQWWKFEEAAPKPPEAKKRK
jgi:hypothetical protein